LVHLCSQQIAGSDNEEWLGIKVGLFAVLYAVTRGRRVFFAASNETEMFRVNNRGVVQRNCGRGDQVNWRLRHADGGLFLKSPFAKGPGV